MPKKDNIKRDNNKIGEKPSLAISIIITNC